MSRHHRLCPCCRRKTEHLVLDTGGDLLAWCQHCFRVSTIIVAACSARLTPPQ